MHFFQHRLKSSATMSAAAALATLLALSPKAHAQDLEPRRWAHLPVGTTVAGLSYAYTEGDLSLDPVLELANVEMTASSVVAGASHWFDLLGKTGRIDLLAPFVSARWQGLLSGAPASTRREGFTDPWIRLSVNLLGAPSLQSEEYAKYRAAKPINTVVGVALAVSLPLGDYNGDKLINLGQNRFVFRPQAGVVHTRGAWSYELTGSAFFYTANDEFFGGNRFEQDPNFALQTHVIRTFSNKWWVSASVGYSWGGEGRVNGVRKDDDRSYVLSALAIGAPIGKRQGLKLAYIRGETRVNVGTDTNSLVLSWSVRM